MKLSVLDKALYAMYLDHARLARAALKCPPAHCCITGLDFNARTRSASLWGALNAIQALRLRARG